MRILLNILSRMLLAVAALLAMVACRNDEPGGHENDTSLDIVTFDYDDDNLRKAYAKYRSTHGLLQPDEIKTIREQYGVSQVTFARIIGVGDKTIARYENGSLQDEAINNLIMLAQDPKNFSLLLDKNEHLIAHDEVKRLRETLGRVKVFAVWSNTQSDYTYNFGKETEYLMYA